MLDKLYGLSIFTDMNLLVDGEPYEVKRTWRERFKSNFFKKTKTIVPKVPDPNYYVLPNNQGLVMHPVTYEIMKKAFTSDTNDDIIKF